MRSRLGCTPHAVIKTLAGECRRGSPKLPGFQPLREALPFGLDVCVIFFSRRVAARAGRLRLRRRHRPHRQNGSKRGAAFFHALLFSILVAAACIPSPAPKGNAPQRRSRRATSQKSRYVQRNLPPRHCDHLWHHPIILRVRMQLGLISYFVSFIHTLIHCGTILRVSRAPFTPAVNPNIRLLGMRPGPAAQKPKPFAALRPL